MSWRKAIIFIAANTALALGALAAVTALQENEPRREFDARDITGVDWGKDFELTDHHGRRRTLADFQGKVVMLFFGFTHCPDMCPTTMALLAQAVRQLGPDGQQVQGLFVTVDPRRDTPQVLSQYAPAFHPTFLGLYADDATTARTAKEFKAYYRLQPPNRHGSYTVDHSTQVFVFDRRGRLRLFFNPDATPDSVAKDLRLLINEPQ